MSISVATTPILALSGGNKRAAGLFLDAAQYRVIVCRFG